jgi:hypothetical protein
MDTNKAIAMLELEDSKLCNHSPDEYCENCFNELEYEMEEKEENYE